MEKSNAEYKTLIEKIVDNSSLRKTFIESSKFFEGTVGGLDLLISHFYKAPTAIRKFLNRNSPHNSLFDEEDTTIVSGLSTGIAFGFCLDIGLPLMNIAYCTGGLEELSVPIHTTKTIAVVTNLISLIYEAGRFRQSKKERSKVLNKIRTTKERQ